MSEQTKYERTLAEQESAWPRLVAMGKQGNPFATLCENCYGRHAPPKDAICPHENIEITKTRLKGRKP